MRTNAETEEFYDRHDATYRSFWDPAGSLHWGLYAHEPSADGGDYLAACDATNVFLRRALGPLASDSHILDLGCGNGVTSIWLARQTGAQVTGIDLSGVRIGQAKELARQNPALNVSFLKSSATDLPFPDGAFSHAWSQATLYHVHDRARALGEVARVLREGGVFVFDDLVQPREEVSALAQRFVYDRLLYGPTYSHDGYRAALAENHLMVVADEDWSLHLRRSYQALAVRAHRDHPELSLAYEKMIEAIDLGDLGWSFFKAIRVADPLAWVYKGDADVSLLEKYNAWAPLYEAAVGNSYHQIIATAAARFVEALPADASSILDLGCGTGLVGAALARHTGAELIGIDPSREMLRRCAGAGVYGRLHEARIEDLATVDGLPVAAAISVGVFTRGHVPLDRLSRALAAVRPNGVLGVVLRDDIASGPEFDAAAANLPAQLLRRVTLGLFDGHEMALYLWKRNG